MEEGPLDVRAELDQAGVSPFHCWVVLVLGLAAFFDGYDLFIPTYVIPQAMQDWQLAPNQAGLLVSSGLLGFFLGSLLNGWVANRLGRKPTLILALSMGALLNWVTARWVGTFSGFLLIRVLTGICLGMVLPSSVTLLNEIAPRRSSNLLIGWMMVGWSLGGVAAALLALWWVHESGWRMLFLVGAIVSPLPALLLTSTPESPRFLAIRQQTERLRRTLSRLVPSRAARYRNASFTLVELHSGRSSLRALFATDVRAATFLLWFCAAGSLFTIYGLSTWTPQLMLQRGESLRSSFAFGALLQFMAILGGLGCGWLADRLDGRRALYLAWGLAVAALVTLGLITHRTANLLSIGVAGFCVMGAQPVLTNLAASFYPTQTRSTGVGAQTAVGRVGGILGPYVGGWVQQLLPGSQGLLYLMAALLCACAWGMIRMGADIPAAGQRPLRS
jgi:MFS transporter, AAHS family, 4-hydroxybenzoate transporter